MYANKIKRKKNYTLIPTASWTKQRCNAKRAEKIKLYYNECRHWIFAPHTHRDTHINRIKGAAKVTKQRRKRKMNGIFYIAFFGGRDSNNNSKDQTSDDKKKDMSQK